MIKMLEVVGTSPESYADATTKAVEALAAAGEKMHWFEVIEMRGAIKDGKIKEFQVKLKIGVE